MHSSRLGAGLAAAAGLAISASAHAQFQYSTGIAGTFTDISAAGNGTGTALTFAGVDDASTAFTSAVTNALVTTTSLYASTNGVISTVAYTGYTNTAMPLAGLGMALLPQWDDLYVDAPGQVLVGSATEGGAPVQIIQWSQVRHIAGATRGDFEVKIFGAGGPALVQFIYHGDQSWNTNASSATIGIQDGSSPQNVLQFSYNTASTATDLVVSFALLPNSGACCIPGTLSCSITDSAGCTSQGGTFQGVNSSCATANCPSPGACCNTDGSCSQTTGSACTGAGGIYRGDSTGCASANCPMPANTWVEQGDAASLPASAQVTTGADPLNLIHGVIGANSDADMYKLQICDPASFSASTVAYTATDALSDTQLFLFDSTGMGVQSDDDDPVSGTVRSNMSNQYVTAAGAYYLAISGYNHDPLSDGGLIWANTPFNVLRQPDGPGAASPVTGWDSGTSSTGSYGIALTGTCFASQGGPTCYANCDHSTAVPFLNVQDFSCFLAKFAANDPYANCDNSTTAPVLNVQDFSCFLGKFATGCSAP